MRWPRVALYFVISLASILTIAAVFVLNTDLGRFKGTTESFLSELLEREFAIDGELHVSVGRRIEISAENIRLAGTEWSTDPNLVEMDRFSAVIRTLSLLNGPILIENVDIQGVRASLEQDSTGNDNWTRSAAESEAEVPVVAERPSLPVLVTDATVRDVLVSYDNPDRPQPFQFRASNIDLSRLESNRLELEIDGAINDRLVELLVTAATIDGLVEFRNVDFTLTGHVGEIRMEGTATLEDMINPERPTAKLYIEGPNAEYLTELLRVEPLTTGPLNLNASIAPLGETMLVAVNGKFGEFSIDSSGHVDNLKSLQNFDVRVAASGPDASTVGRLLGNDAVPGEPFSIVASLGRAGSMLTIDEAAIAIGKTQLKVVAQIAGFPDPIGTRLTMRASGPDFGRFNKLLGLPGQLSGPFSMDVDLTPITDQETSVSLATKANDVQFTIEGTVNGSPQFVGTQLQAKLQAPNLRTLTEAAGIEHAPADAVDLVVAIERVDKGVRIDSGKASIGNGRAEFSGLIGNEPLERDTDMQLKVSGQNLAKTLVAFGIDADKLPYAPYQLAGRVERTDAGFALHELKANIGSDREYEATAEGIVTLEPDFVGSQLDVSVRGASLDAVADAAGVAGIPNAAFEASAIIGRSENGFSIQNGSARFGDDSIRVDGFIGEQPLERNTDIRFSGSAPDLKATLAAFGMEVEALPAGAFDGSGRIRSRGNQILLNDVSTTLAGAKMKLGGTLGGIPSMNGTDLQIEISGDELSRLLPVNDAFVAFDKSFSLNSKISVKNDVLALSKLEFRLESSHLDADLEFALDPRLGRGRFTIDAGSPDVLVFAPELSQTSSRVILPFDLKTSGSWVNAVWTLDNFSMLLGQGTLRAQGSIDRPPNFDKTDFMFDLDIASVDNFSVLAGRPLPDDPARVTFHLSGTRNVMTMDDFQAAIGDSDFTGALTIRSGEVPNFDVQLRSRRLNIAPYLPPIADKDPAEVTVAEERARLIPATDIPLDELEKFRSAVDISIGELVLRQRSLKNIELLASVDNGALLVPKFSLENSVGGTVSGGFALKSVDTFAELLLDIQGSALHLGLPAETPDELASLPRFDVDTVLAGRGKTYSELAGSLGGYMRIVGGEGKIRSSALSHFAGDFLLEVIDAVNPFVQSDPYTKLKCAAALGIVRDGVVSGKPFLVAETDKIRVFSEASVDLKSEKISANIRTVPMKGLGLSFSGLVNPFIKVNGTLLRPTLALDPESALLEGGAAVATGGLSFLAKQFKDRFLTSKDQCGKAIEEANSDFLAQREKYRPGTSEQRP